MGIKPNIPTVVFVVSHCATKLRRPPKSNKNTQQGRPLPPRNAGRGAAARGVTAKPTGYGFDPHSRR